MGDAGQRRNYRPCLSRYSGFFARVDRSSLGVYRTEGTMYTTLDLSRQSNGVSGQAGFSWGDTAKKVNRERYMTKSPLRRRLAFKILGWWRDMIGDLYATQQDVDAISHRVHKLAGRMHVLEMEAYGETRPRHTLRPPTKNPLEQ